MNVTVVVVTVVLVQFEHCQSVNGIRAFSTKSSYDYEEIDSYTSFNRGTVLGTYTLHNDMKIMISNNLP